MKPQKNHMLSLCLLLFAITCLGQQIRPVLENQISSWGTLNISDPVKSQLGVRYIPTLSITDSLKNNCKVDLEISANLYGNLDFMGCEFDEADARVKPYRGWLRYSTPRFELRLGLQKINFGSATIFRPLMWFDKLDFRDPLQLTDGVYALLCRYYFQNNSNIWIWSLYGNKDPIGWESIPSDSKKPEAGGRFQQAIPKGEIALSFHHREADFSAVYDTIPFITVTRYPENKLGLDGKWDLGIGLWFEYVVKRNDPDNKLNNPWETYFNAGADYTFAIGNGLNMTAEYFRYDNTTELFKKGLNNTFTAVSLNYPFGLMNSAAAIVYYNWDTDEWSRFVSLQRKYDYWSFHFMAFWNPETSRVLNLSSDRNLFSGKGVQMMAVVNF